MVFSWKKYLSQAGIAVFMTAITCSLVFAQSNDIIPDDLTSGSGSQGFDIGVNENDIDLNISPENPGAFTTVALQLSSDFIDLNRYMIRWFIDGALFQEGIGKRTGSAKTKNYGQRTIIMITIDLPTGTIQKQMVLAPGDVTVLWEAMDSYTPPFYPGKKLPGRESSLRVTAIPNFANVTRLSDIANGVYYWKRNDLTVPEAGGYGKSSFSFRHNKIRGSEKISVVATSLNNSYRAESSVNLALYDPKILFYEQDPTTDIRSPLAKKVISFTGDTIDVIAEPYYFSTDKNNVSKLNFAWTMNNEPITIANTRQPNLLSLENPGGSGIASLKLSIEHPLYFMQTATSTLSALFKR